MHARTKTSGVQAHGAVPGEVLVQSTDRLMQLAACHAWSRQEELAAAAEHSLTQAVSNAEAGVADDTPHPPCMPMPCPAMHLNASHQSHMYSPGSDCCSSRGCWKSSKGVPAQLQSFILTYQTLLPIGGSTPGVWLAAVPAASALSVLPPISDAPRLAKVASGLVTIACSAAPRAVAELAADSAAAVVNKASTGMLLLN